MRRGESRIFQGFLGPPRRPRVDAQQAQLFHWGGMRGPSSSKESVIVACDLRQRLGAECHAICLC